MKFSIIKCSILLIVVLIIYEGNAQNTRLIDKNSIGWFGNFVTIKFGEKWSGHLEYQWRREDIIKTWQQGLFRTGINYNLSSKLTVRLGYAWIETFNYGDIPLQTAGKRFPEHRIYQMVSINDNIGKAEMNHRFLLEQRWVGRYTNVTLLKPDDFTFTNRLRYMNRIQFALGKKKIVDKTAYAALYNEIIIGFGKNVAENVFDQNRLAILLGYKFNSKVKIESGYIYQIAQLGRELNNQNIFQHNNGLIFNAYYNFNLSKKK